MRHTLDGVKLDSAGGFSAHQRRVTVLRLPRLLTATEASGAVEWVMRS